MNKVIKNAFAWGEHNYADYSDFYVLVYDETTNSIKEEDIGRGYACGGGYFGICDDFAQCLDFEMDTRPVKAIYRNRAKNELAQEIVKEAQSFEKFDTVIVTRGRKVPKGTTGKVFWMGTNFNPYSGKLENKCGIETDDGTRYFLLCDYCINTEWQDRCLYGDELRKAIVRRTEWLYPYDSLFKFPVLIKKN